MTQKNVSFKSFGKILTEEYIESMHRISPCTSCLFRAHSVILILEKPRADLLHLYRRYIPDSGGVAAAATVGVYVCADIEADRC